MISAEELLFLEGLAREVQPPECVVEVGSYRGRSTAALAAGSRAGGGAAVYAIEPHEQFTGVLGGQFGPEDRKHFFQNMLHAGATAEVRLVNLSSDVIAPGWTTPIGLLWLDGDHAYEGVARDFRVWEPHSQTVRRSRSTIPTRPESSDCCASSSPRVGAWTRPSASSRCC